MDFYNIEVTYNENGFHLLNQISFPILFPCDLYYLPYSKQYFGKYHVFHYVVIERIDKFGKAIVYDDNPLFHGQIDIEFLLSGYHNISSIFNYEPVIEIYNKKSDLKKTLKEEINFVKENINFETFFIKDFIYQLIHSNLDIQNKLVCIKDMILLTKRLYALTELAKILSSYIQHNYIDRYVKVLQNYADYWTMTVNMATRYYDTNNFLKWDRIEQRLLFLIDLENESKKAILNLMEFY